MSVLNSIDMIQAALNLEMNRLEVTTSNLANLNQTFSNKLDVVGNKTVTLELPSLEGLLEGSQSINYDELIFLESSKIESIVKNEGGKLSVSYKSDTRIEEELVKLGDVKRAYETSLRLFNLSKKLNEQTLQIGNKN